MKEKKPFPQFSETEPPPYNSLLPLSPEAEGLFEEIDALLRSGEWKFLGNFWDGKGYEIKLQQTRTAGGGEKPLEKTFRCGVSYDRIVFADGKTEPPLETKRKPVIPSPS